MIAIGVAVVAALFAAAVGGARGHGIDLDKATEGDIARLVMGGHKIAAITVYRRLHQVDLQAAKDAVERLEASLPKPIKTS